MRKNLSIYYDFEVSQCEGKCNLNAINGKLHTFVATFGTITVNTLC